eukprot:7461020-Heterocapsa_arctica.AAC.1
MSLEKEREIEREREREREREVDLLHRQCWPGVRMKRTAPDEEETVTKTTRSWKNLKKALGEDPAALGIEP